MAKYEIELPDGLVPPGHKLEFRLAARGETVIVGQDTDLALCKVNIPTFTAKLVVVPTSRRISLDLTPDEYEVTVKALEVYFADCFQADADNAQVKISRAWYSAEEIALDTLAPGFHEGAEDD